MEILCPHFGEASSSGAEILTMDSVKDTPFSEEPTHCKAGVVVNEGSDFRIEVHVVPVPELYTENLTQRNLPE